MSLDDLTIVTYSHSRCADLWEPYLGALDLRLPGMPSILMADVEAELPPPHRLARYDEQKSYCLEFARILKSEVRTSCFLYMQEDFFLYDDVDGRRLSRFVELVGSGRADFIRLIRCGKHTTLPQDGEPDLFLLKPPGAPHDDPTSFSMQPTIWSRDRFIEFYELANVASFQEGVVFNEAMNRLRLNGLYAYRGEPKRGMNHWDSSVFPYVATAIVKGRWNVREYAAELAPFFEQYAIDPGIRGVF